MCDVLYFPTLNRSLVAVSADLEKWCKKWDLEVYTGTCGGCGKKQIVNIPWYGDGVRGLKAADCACGCNHFPFSVVHLDPDHALNKCVGGGQR